MSTSKALFTPAELQAAASELVTMSHRCYVRGWSPATSSNYSLRLNAEALAITCSGLDKGALTTDGIMAIDLEAKPLTAGKPSAETLLHTQLYRRFPDCGAVLHTHSPQATVLSRHLCAQPALLLRDYELAKAFSGITTHADVLAIPFFENTQDIAALALAVDAHCQQRAQQQNDLKAYIIRGHGLYVWGATMSDCWRHLEALEFMLACELQALLLAQNK